jgi:hypothetical protein
MWHRKRRIRIVLAEPSYINETPARILTGQQPLLNHILGIA